MTTELHENVATELAVLHECALSMLEGFTKMQHAAEAWAAECVKIREGRER